MASSGKIEQDIDLLKADLALAKFAVFTKDIFIQKKKEEVYKTFKLAYKRTYAQLVKDLDDAIELDNMDLVNLHLDAIQARTQCSLLLDTMYWDQLEELIRDVQENM